MTKIQVRGSPNFSLDFEAQSSSLSIRESQLKSCDDHKFVLAIELYVKKRRT